MLDNQKLCFDQIKVLVTSGCNLNCTHCFRSQDKNEYYLTKENLIEIVDFSVKNSVKTLSFSGGEFFVHPFAYELLEYCFMNNIRVHILTNATEINISFFERYKNLNLVSFQVSIDGLEETHNQRRGVGSFEKTMGNVQKLYDLGISISASMVIDIYNYKDVIHVLKLPYFNAFNFLPVASTNNENSYMDELSEEEKQEYEETIKLIYQNKVSFLGKEHRCHMFPYGLGIKYDGGVYPCAVARDYGLLCMGNLHEKSLDEIVNSFSETDAGQIVSHYISNDIDECNNCTVNGKCNRGCRIRAYKYYGDLMKPDPFCCRILDNKLSEESMNCLFWGNAKSECI